MPKTIMNKALLVMPDALLQYLHDQLGLNPSSINKQSLLNAVRFRMRIRNVDNPHQYTIMVQQQKEEFLQLVEKIVVPETSFFRHAAAFSHLSHLTQQYKKKKLPLRILCIPSSTGEEPYSIAMCLLHDGWQANDFTIDALDVSSRALARAKTGVYQPYSFRGNMIQQYMHFFSETPKGYRIADEVRQCVRFHQRNILDADRLLTLGFYPIIFCRNLLIYLHRKARCKVAQTLAAILEKEGTLFAGNAENSNVWNNYFTSSRVPMSFAMRHADPLTTTKRFCIPPSLLNKTSTTAVSVQKKHYPQSISLTSIKTLADKGEMLAVIDQCKVLLSTEPNNATCYFYLALAHAAQDENNIAIKKLRKAIYLQADYQEALQQLALLLDLKGEKVAAKRMRQRLLIVREHANHE
ncbi:MAG: protein-glutamate O-methyltransferase CheR [Mariprofundaceae bacterium]|nr:protein-glutamate O-methyltransferase CheR [Mariprofundaceae bacterium]